MEKKSFRKHTWHSRKARIIALINSQIFLVAKQVKSLRHLVELLDDGEDKQGAEKTDAGKDSPDNWEGDVCSPEKTWNHHKLVAYGRCTKPKSHHNSSILRRGNLRYEADADWREEELCEGEHEIGGDK